MTARPLRPYHVTCGALEVILMATSAGMAICNAMDLYQVHGASAKPAGEPLPC